ncbi:hypothetical protein ONS95_008110 [Cadophora gregata]|uniref:uncharacterized protein n=1 Tax=Cadophora gregata TaxID=51156 RepID=UPI0026DDAFA9|nr:uncharacterized protein ONS95_008110 [Cadophora gregata]KAK0126514.1 hypothetical protein ONS95_008110 [Cadophora gregata]
MESPKLIQIHPENHEFDFVVAERPKYIPNSGPPLAPISIMPDDENDGIIVASFEVNHLPRYVVSYTEAPYLRISVAPENILNYVSRYTLEQFEYMQVMEREGRNLGKGKVAKGGNAFEARDEELKQKAKPGRKRKHALVEADDEKVGSRFKVIVGPASRVARKSIEEPEPVFTSPQRPTLASPSKQRGLADMMESESEEEEESTYLAIEAQLSSTMESHPRSRLHMNVALSPSPQPSSASKGKSKALSPAPRDDRSSSRRARSSRSQSASVSARTSEAKHQRPPTRNESFATTSSLEAGKIDERMEREKSRSRTPSKKTGHWDKYSSIVKSEGQSASSKQDILADNDADEDEVLGEEEYEVEAILDETQYRVGKKGKHVVTYYLIKWVGNWPLSWEPAENVGSESIEVYERKKDMGLITVGEAGAAFDAVLEAEEAAALAREKEEKIRKKNKRGYDAVGGSDEDHKRKETRGSAFKYHQPIQGQVIDDDDASEYDSEYE